LLRAARDRSASVDDVKRRAAVEAEAPTGVDPAADGARRDGLRRLRGAGTDAADPAPTALALTDPTRPDSAAITGLPTAPVDPLAQAAADGMGEPADAAGAAESAGAAGAAGAATPAATPATRTENPVRMPGDGLVNPQVMGLRANTEAATDDAASDAAPGRGGKARDARMAAAGPASDAPGVDPRQLAAIPSKGGADGAGTSFQDVMVAATGRAAASSGADTQAPAPAPLAGLPGFAAELARSSQALTPGGLVGSARELNLPMPMTAAEFVPRLTGDLAVLARDGVQEARVNVHPVELGPISVQITLDGAAAQVHLAADSAQTRDLLEQAMPALAAALRDNGLTLTGGGVFQQARQQPREPSSDTGSGRAGTAAAEAGPVDSAGAGESTRRLRPVGALDVYA
jgi:flagellar hook-length control protein FliK